jgi:uncharacterized protein YbcI
MSNRAPAGRTPPSEQAQTLAAISRRVGELLKEYSGKGPTNARTYHEGDLVVVLMAGGVTKVEQTLYDENRDQAVSDQRQELQAVMRVHFKRVIEEEMRREVVAAMSAHCHEPDYRVHLFILRSRGPAT